MQRGPRMSIKSNWRTFSAGVLLALSFNASAAPLPATLQKAYPDFTSLGEGSMTWFGLHIYTATLWSSTQPFDPRRPFALAIQYQRNFSAERIIDSTLGEMRRLGKGTPAQQADWAAAMRRVFPDIQSGDTLIGLALPGRGTRFFSATGSLGDIDDPAFTDAFFAIWLDARTREPGLRETLLGKQ